jgi:predicted Mrr-cat superfamily restriction endonuclease
MNLFQVKCKPHGHFRLNDFIQGKFIAIGWPGIGNLKGVSKEEIKTRLLNPNLSYSERYKAKQGTVSVDLGNIWAFVDTMKTGDTALFQGHQDNVYIVEVGPYKYVEEFDTDEDGMCHQRDFKLLKTVKYEELNLKVQRFLGNRGTVTKFKYPLEEAELALSSLSGGGSDQPYMGTTKSDPVPEEIIKEALAVLYEDLESEDPDKRSQAAIEILRYSKR